MIIHAFKVAGSGQFPMDMLRYDAAWPASTSDAHLIHETIEARWMHDATRQSLRATMADKGIILHSYQKPTIARWASFGWACEEVEL